MENKLVILLIIVLLVGMSFSSTGKSLWSKLYSFFTSTSSNSSTSTKQPTEKKDQIQSGGVDSNTSLANAIGGGQAVYL